MGCGRRPFYDLIERLSTGQRRGGEGEGFHDETHGMNDIEGHWSLVADS